MPPKKQLPFWRGGQPEAFRSGKEWQRCQCLFQKVGQVQLVHRHKQTCAMIQDACISRCLVKRRGRRSDGHVGVAMECRWRHVISCRVATDAILRPRGSTGRRLF